MVYDAARRRVVLFDGAETWEYGFRGTLTLSGTPRLGGTVGIGLTATNDAGLPYLLGSALGTGPIRIDTRQLGLSPDGLLFVTVMNALPTIFFGYRGSLDARGQAQAAVRVPNHPPLVGLRIHSAFVTLDPTAPSGIRSISSTASLTITR
jgi:hypothetical protein